MSNFSRRQILSLIGGLFAGATAKKVVPVQEVPSVVTPTKYDSGRYERMDALLALLNKQWIC